MELYGKKMTKDELMKYIGDISQIADARECVLSSGREDGVRAIDVCTGSGLQFTVLPSRGMDIAWARYKGNAVSFISKAGVSHPAYFEKDGLSFLRGFFCGLVTTCGLTYFGAPCEDEGQKLGLHGRISNIPAQNVCVNKYWDGDDYVIKISGQVRESTVFGENLLLTREIETSLGAKSLKIRDIVENQGFDEQPFMILYHCNFGYPIVDENTILLEPEGAKVEARDKDGVAEKCFEFQRPAHAYQEQVFYHDIPGNEVRATLYNPVRELGAYVAFKKDQLSHFGEWKMMGEGDYAVGLEPSNAIPEGRDVVRGRGELEYIKPGERRIFELEIGVVEKPEKSTDGGKQNECI